MVIIRHSRGINQGYYFQGAGDVANNGEQTQVSGSSNWSGSTNIKSMIIGSLQQTLSNMKLMIIVNGNTIDGAVINVQKTDLPAEVWTNVNQNIVIDQATGLFEDLTNSDITIEDRSYKYFYTFGNGTATSRGLSMRWRSA